MSGRKESCGGWLGGESGWGQSSSDSGLFVSEDVEEWRVGRKDQIDVTGVQERAGGVGLRFWTEWSGRRSFGGSTRPK